MLYLLTASGQFLPPDSDSRCEASNRNSAQPSGVSRLGTFLPSHLLYLLAASGQFPASHFRLLGCPDPSVAAPSETRTYFFLIGALGDVVAQLVERRLQYPMDFMIRGSNTVRSSSKICESFSKCCADSLSVCPTTVKDPVVHVRVRWIMETRK